MAEVFLKGGHVVHVDDADLQLIAPYSWYLGTAGYAVTAFHRKGASRADSNRTVNVSMHRLIAGFPDCKVDHIDRDRLNNRRVNLRLATDAQNVWNNSKVVGASGYIGVRKESSSCFSARLGKLLLGYYPTGLLAAQAHDIAAVAQRGEFARLNFPVESLPEKVEALPARNTGARTSSTVGVSLSKTRKAKQKWRAVYRKQHLGWFLTEKEAVIALAEAKDES